MRRTHYLLQNYTACLRDRLDVTLVTKAIRTVDCKRCIAAMSKQMGRLPSPAELAATDATREIERREATQ